MRHPLNCRWELQIIRAQTIFGVKQNLLADVRRRLTCGGSATVLPLPSPNERFAGWSTSVSRWLGVARERGCAPPCVRGLSSITFSASAFARANACDRRATGYANRCTTPARCLRILLLDRFFSMAAVTSNRPLLPRLLPDGAYSSSDCRSSGLGPPMKTGSRDGGAAARGKGGRGVTLITGAAGAACCATCRILITMPGELSPAGRATASASSCSKT